MAAREDDLKAKMLRALDGDGVAYRALLHGPERSGPGREISRP